jgi:hypothetical protein
VSVDARQFDRLDEVPSLVVEGVATVGFVVETPPCELVLDVGLDAVAQFGDDVLEVVTLGRVQLCRPRR